MFGLTWPVLELLGENAEFFLARRSSRWEILGLAIVLLAVVPILLALLGSIPGKVGGVIGAVMIALLAVATSHYLLSRIPVAWWVSLIAAVVVGAGFTLLLYRLPVTRWVVKYLLWSPLVFMIMFLFATPSGEMALDSNGTPGSPSTVDAPAPLIFLVFDEFPVASLMAPDGSLRAATYPNFARLAADGTWYRNAVTVEQQTEHSVPALLTGVVPDQSLTPFAGQYPNNLFTALQESHDLDVYESITRLCPTTICEGSQPSATPLTKDVLVVAGHVLLPDSMTDQLPPIDGSWGDFASVAEDFNAVAAFLEEMETGERAPIEEMIADIRSFDGERPPFFFLHALTPHHPWHTLPDGREYPQVLGYNPASKGGGFIDDDYLVAQGMQRHLLQVGFVDHMLGEIIGALEESGMYDEAMVVVVADHGIAVKPGVAHQRTITPETVGDIAAVPLIVKLPNDEGGVIDDRRALTIDIVSTIADQMAADLAWDPEGVSLLGDPADRSQTTTVGTKGPVTYGVDGHEKFEVAERIERWFPGGDLFALLPPGAPDILGDSMTLDGLPASTIKAQIRRSSVYQNVDVDAPAIPVFLAGILTGDVDGDELIGVTVNGVVAAVVRSYQRNDEYGFQAMIPTEMLVDGGNEIRLFEVTPAGYHVINPS